MHFRTRMAKVLMNKLQAAGVVTVALAFLVSDESAALKSGLLRDSCLQINGRESEHYAWFCAGFISGVHAGTKTRGIYCPPGDGTGDEAAQGTARAYLESHRELGDEDAADTLIQAFSEAFPCPRGENTDE